MGKGLTSKVNNSNDYFWCGKVKGLNRKLCLFLTEKCFVFFEKSNILHNKFQHTANTTEH